MLIYRCVCTDRTFADLLQEARKHHDDLDTLAARTGAGHKCALCRPYLRRALDTGQTTFTQIIVGDEDDASPRTPG